jgi:hypothetical protein
MMPDAKLSERERQWLLDQAVRRALTYNGKLTYWTGFLGPDVELTAMSFGPAIRAEFKRLMAERLNPLAAIEKAYFDAKWRLSKPDSKFQGGF